MPIPTAPIGADACPAAVPEPSARADGGPARRPIIGIIGNSHMINDEYPAYATGEINVSAVAEVAQAVPLIVPPDPRWVAAEDLMEVCAGFLFTGGRPNVHPEEYGEPATEAHGAFDRARDAVVLRLIRACVARGQPIFGVCRGFQEVAVAFGSTLDPEIRDLPGRDNHRMPPEGTQEERFALRHDVSFAEGGVFHRLMGERVVRTNTLHGQGLRDPGPRIVVDGWAPDGTAEALYVEGAPGFSLSVQWHPEWNAARDPVSRTLFGAFGAAVRAWEAGARVPMARTA